MPLQWPESVLVLDPECGHDLKDVPGANIKNQPQNPMGWANDEFRGIKAPLSQVDLMLRIWEYRYECLRFYRAKYPHTYSEYDIYNAAWVACGYTEDQPESAIKLCKERFNVEPNGTVLNDPRQKIKKKVKVVKKPIPRRKKSKAKVA